MLRARLKIGTGRISTLLMIPVLAMQTPALADCPFGWSPVPEVPGIGTSVNTIVTWDPDCAGPLPPLLVVGGWTRLNPGVEPPEFSGGVSAWDGGAWTVLGGGMNEQVKALAVYEGDLYAGGHFTSAGGTAVNYFARWDGTTWQDVGNGVTDSVINPNNLPRVLALEVYNGMLVLGGRFSIAGGTAGFDNIGMWDGQSWYTVGTGTTGRVHALAAYGGSLYAGGLISNAGGVPVSRIARWNADHWEAMPNQPLNGMDDQVHSLAVFQGKLFAGGLFTHAAGLPANSIVAWDGNTWSALGDGLTGGNTPTVNAMTGYDGRLIAGGRFTTADGQPANNIAQWDGNGWQELGEEFNTRVDALTVHNGDMIAGGFFTVGDESSHVARWVPNCLPGDMNCDLAVSMDDAPLFIDALLNAPAISTCDAHIANMNGDMQSDGTPKIDGSDVAAFVQALLNP